MTVAFGGDLPPAEPASSSVAALPAGRDTPGGGSRASALGSLRCAAVARSLSERLGTLNVPLYLLVGLEGAERLLEGCGGQGRVSR